MPELRKDPVVGRWVIIATERARRPGSFVTPEENVFDDHGDCPFCKEEGQTIFTIKNPHPGHGQKNWQVRVVPNGHPIFRIEEEFQRKGHGLFDVISGYGAHEVVVETPEHIANMADLSVSQIRMVIETYATRFRDLENDPHLQYILAYKNYGWKAGSRRIGHARSQIMASPVNMMLVKEKLVGTKKYYEFHDRCVYCDVIAQETAAHKRVVTENENFVAMIPFAPRFPFEVWIIPKQHNCDFARGVIGHEENFAKILKDILLRLKIGLDDPSYNYVLHSAPLRKHQQKERFKNIEEDFHWHLELIPRLTRVAGFEKGTGFYICPIPPEDSAEFLREVDLKQAVSQTSEKAIH